MMSQADSQDKTEQPTEKKRTEAKKKGQVPRSRELSMMLVTISAAIMLMFYGTTMMRAIADLLTNGLSLNRDQLFEVSAMINQLTAIAFLGFKVIAPFMLLMFLASLGAPTFMGGWSFSLASIQPKFEKLNPIKGIRKVFSAKGIVELIKAFLKFLLVGSAMVVMLSIYFQDILLLAEQPILLSLNHSGTLIIDAFFWVSLSLIIIAVIDAPFQLFEHNKQLKMTKQEIKDEHKQTEGSPEVKSKIKQLQQAVANRRMMDRVPEANVIITNPTHVAIAIEYRKDSMQAPKVIAKGKGYIALQIKAVATSVGLPCLESPPLARALFATCDIGQEIPQGLYKAVAQVLAYIYELENFKRLGGKAPKKPQPDFDKSAFDY